MAFARTRHAALWPALGQATRTQRTPHPLPANPGRLGGRHHGRARAHRPAPCRVQSEPLVKEPGRGVRPGAPVDRRPPTVTTPACHPLMPRPGQSKIHKFVNESTALPPPGRLERVTESQLPVQRGEPHANSPRRSSAASPQGVGTVVSGRRSGGRRYTRRGASGRGSRTRTRGGAECPARGARSAGPGPAGVCRPEGGRGPPCATTQWTAAHTAAAARTSHRTPHVSSRLRAYARSAVGRPRRRRSGAGPGCP